MKKITLSFLAVAVLFSLTMLLGGSADTLSRLNVSYAAGVGAYSADIVVIVEDENGLELERESFSNVSTSICQMTFTYRDGEVTGLSCNSGEFLTEPAVSEDSVSTIWMCSGGNDSIEFTITVKAEAEPEAPDVEPPAEETPTTPSPEPVVTELSIDYSDALSMLYTAGIRVDDDTRLLGGTFSVDGQEYELDAGSSSFTGEINCELDSSSVVVIIIFYSNGSTEMSAKFTDSFDISFDGDTLSIESEGETVVLEIEGFGYRILGLGETVGALPQPEAEDGETFLGWQDEDGDIVDSDSRIYGDTKLTPVFSSVTGYADCKVLVLNTDGELIAFLEEKYGRVDVSSVRIRLLGDDVYGNEDYFENAWDSDLDCYIISNCTAESDGVDERANTHIPADEISGITIFADTYSGPVRCELTLDDIHIDIVDSKLAEISLDSEPYLELDTRGRFAYMQGRTDTLFAPEESITRAEAAAIIYRCLSSGSLDSLEIRGRFNDVSYRSWYADAVELLSGAGLFDGYADGGFHPDASITRGEFAAIAVRLLGEDELNGTGVFTDTAGSWARGYINRAAQLGLVSGYSDGSFRPDNTITRAEAAKLINGMLGRDTSGFVWSTVSWDDVDPGAWYYLDVIAATTGVVRD